MRAVSILAVLLLLIADGLALASLGARLPAAVPYQQDLLIAALALGFIALVAILATRRAPAPAPAPPPVAEPVRPAPPPPTVRPEAQVVGFLALLQEKGRLVDFLMDDINAYPDAQVGAAARVVHAGCRSVLQEHFRIRPVREEAEGATVQVAAGYAADEIRLLGRVAGQPPFTGVLVHRGWKTEVANLPRIVPGGAADRLPAIAPAEVELK